MAKTSTALKTYGTFSKATAAKTGAIKVTKTHATREAARAFKRAKSYRFGIFNLATGMVIR